MTVRMCHTDLSKLFNLRATQENELARVENTLRAQRMVSVELTGPSKSVNRLLFCWRVPQKS